MNFNLPGTSCGRRGVAPKSSSRHAGGRLSAREISTSTPRYYQHERLE